MADATITAGDVLAGAGAKRKRGTAGATIVAGRAVYLDNDTDTYKLSRCNAAGTARIDGISLNNASAGQPLHLQTEGVVFLGGGLQIGHLYTVSVTTAGNIRPTEDIEGDDYIAFAGVAIESDSLELHLFASPVQLE